MSDVLFLEKEKDYAVFIFVQAWCNFKLTCSLKH